MSNRKRTQFSSTMNNEYFSQLKELSEESGVPMSKLLDKAVQLLVSDMNDHLYKVNVAEKPIPIHGNKLSDN